MFDGNSDEIDIKNLAVVDLCRIDSDFTYC